MHTTKVFSQLLDAYTDPAVRIVALEGSSRSGKTFSSLQLLDQIARRTTKERVISVVSETMPHLKRGAIRDFETILDTDKVFNRKAWHDTDKIYTYPSAKLEFFSADNYSKVTGPSRNILYINEAINVEKEIYRQLAIRTTEKIILDYNPASTFWLDDMILKRNDIRVLHSTYLDNDFLSAAQIAELESNREIDPEWWEVYGLGMKGSTQGLCIKNWELCDRMPSNLKKEWIGIDWGWSKPTAIMHVGLGEEEKVYIDELAYKPRMENKDIAQVIIDAGLTHLRTICDEAEPKSIAEIKGFGIRRAEKTSNKDIKLGLQIMNRYKKYYTKRSLGSIEENRKYKFSKDKKTDEYTDEPVDNWNHAKDAERYVFLNALSNMRTGYSMTMSQ